MRLSKDNMEEWAKDLPDWVLMSPGLSVIYVEIQEFLTRVAIMGADPEEARQRAMKLIQDGDRFEQARDKILEEIARGTFT